jgi:hypothetical protein
MKTSKKPPQTTRHFEELVTEFRKKAFLQQDLSAIDQHLTPDFVDQLRAYVGPAGNRRRPTPLWPGRAGLSDKASRDRAFDPQGKNSDAGDPDSFAPYGRLHGHASHGEGPYHCRL